MGSGMNAVLWALLVINIGFGAAAVVNGTPFAALISGLAIGTLSSAICVSWVWRR